MAKKRKYKYKVPEEIFLKIFNANIYGDDINELKKYGIERLKGSEIKGYVPDKYSKIEIDGHTYKINANEFYFVISDALIEVNKEWITLDDRKKLEYDLFFVNSYIPNFAIHHCKFLNFIDSSGTEIYANLTLINCELCAISLFNSQIGDIRLFNSHAKDITINENSNISTVLLYGHSKIGNTTLIDSKISSIKLYSSEAGKFDVGGASKSEINDFSVKNESSIGDTNAENAVIAEVNIENSKTLSFNFDSIEVKSFNIDSGCEVGELCFYDTTFSHYLEVFRINAGIRITKCTIPYARILASNLPYLKIDGGSKIDLYVERCSVSFLKLIKTNLGKDANVSFATCAIYYFVIQEFAVLGNLYFRYVTPKINLDLFSRDDIEGETLEERRKKFGEQNEAYANSNKALTVLAPTIIISQSSLGKTEFTECDLTAFEFQCDNSKITEIFISGGTMPKDIKVYNETNPIKILEQKKSFFDQLKKVFEGQGDIVRGTEYHAKASEIQKSIIERKMGDNPKWHQQYRNTEWLVYRLNEASNNHGQSWGKAIKFILWWSVPLYILYWFCTGVAIFSLNPYMWDWDLFLDFVGYYFSFLLPTHKIDFVPGADLNLGTMAFDFAGRILIGYGIYQLISAFRKHGKKV